MARPGGRDKGLYSQTMADGSVAWFVRLYYQYRPKKFGSFKTKTEALKCYRRAKVLIDAGEFRPELFYKKRHRHIEAAQEAAKPKPILPIQPPPIPGVYFVKCEDTRHVKIGYSDNIRRRLVTLRISSPSHLHFIGWIDGDRSIETELHRRFADDRVRGEWFKDSEALQSVYQAT